MLLPCYVPASVPSPCECVLDGGTYSPCPVDTSEVLLAGPWGSHTQVVLAKDIEELSHLLAANAHDLWAQQKFKAGWKRGDSPNDELKVLL